MTDKLSLDTLDLVERYATGLATKTELAAARTAAHSAYAAARTAAWDAAYAAAYAVCAATGDSEGDVQANLFILMCEGAL